MPKDVVIDSTLRQTAAPDAGIHRLAHEAAHHILADQFPKRLRKSSQVPWAHCLSGTKRTALMGRMAGGYPCSGAADANISGQRRNRTCSAVPAKWNPVQIRIGPEL